MKRDLHREAVEAAARRLGVHAVPDPEAPETLVLEHGGRRITLREGRPSFLGQDVEAACDDKAACKARLAAIGIPVPVGIVVDREAPNQAAIEAQLARGVPQACKPIAGTHGEHVRLGLRTLEEVLAHVARTPASHAALVLEDEVSGHDLRIQAVGGRLLAACVREPAFVVGTGEDDVRALVDARRSEIRRENPENELPLDEEALELLAQQGLALAAIPEAGRRVRLGRLASVARGAVPIDVTDALHRRYGEWVARIARAFPIELFALDVVTADVTADPERAARVLEINARPEWLHHTFSRGRTHDVAEAILRAAFEL